MLVSLISFEDLPNESTEINEKKILFNTVDDNKKFNYYSIEIDENGYLYNEVIK